MEHRHNPLTELKERQRARKHLAKVNLFEKQAVRWEEHEKIAATLSAPQQFTVDKLKEALTRSLGVTPEKRHKLRAGLERIIAGSRESVDDLLAEINESH